MISHKTNRTMHLPGVYAAGEMKQDLSDLARDGSMLGLWKLGKDTRSIASALNMRESQVANRLAWLRDQGAR